MSTILLAEDDEDLRLAVAEGLAADGHVVEAVASGNAVLDALAAGSPDLLLLDIGLDAGPDGVEVCRRLRRTDTDLHVMVVTARGGEADAVLALEAGADDYVTKPVGLAELRSRVRAALRRTGAPAAGPGPRPVLDVGPLRIDAAARTATAGGVPLALTPSEHAVLAALAGAEGAVRSRAQLVQAIFGDDAYRDPRAVDVHVHHLREKLAAAGADPGLLVTVRGAGYRLAP